MKNSRGEENWASESIKENERRERGVEQKESIISEVLKQSKNIRKGKAWNNQRVQRK
jgi:hypothetical protein